MLLYAVVSDIGRPRSSLVAGILWQKCQNWTKNLVDSFDDSYIMICAKMPKREYYVSCMSLLAYNMEYKVSV